MYHADARNQHWRPNPAGKLIVPGRSDKEKGFLSNPGPQGPKETTYQRATAAVENYWQQRSGQGQPDAAAQQSDAVPWVQKGAAALGRSPAGSPRADQFSSPRRGKQAPAASPLKVPGGEKELARRVRQSCWQDSVQLGVNHDWYQQAAAGDVVPQDIEEKEAVRVRGIPGFTGKQPADPSASRPPAPAPDVSHMTAINAADEPRPRVKGVPGYTGHQPHAADVLHIVGEHGDGEDYHRSYAQHDQEQVAMQQQQPSWSQQQGLCQPPSEQEQQQEEELQRLQQQEAEAYELLRAAQHAKQRYLGEHDVGNRRDRDQVDHPPPGRVSWGGVAPQLASPPSAGEQAQQSYQQQPQEHGAARQQPVQGQLPMSNGHAGQQRQQQQQQPHPPSSSGALTFQPHASGPPSRSAVAAAAGAPMGAALRKAAWPSVSGAPSAAAARPSAVDAFSAPANIQNLSIHYAQAAHAGNQNTNGLQPVAAVARAAAHPAPGPAPASPTYRLTPLDVEDDVRAPARLSPSPGARRPQPIAPANVVRTTSRFAGNPEAHAAAAQLQPQPALSEDGAWKNGYAEYSPDMHSGYDAGAVCNAGVTRNSPPNSVGAAQPARWAQPAVDACAAQVAVPNSTGSAQTGQLQRNSVAQRAAPPGTVFKNPRPTTYNASYGLKPRS